MPVGTRFRTSAFVAAPLGAAFFLASVFSLDSDQDESKRKAIAKVSPKYPLSAPAQIEWQGETVGGRSSPWLRQSYARHRRQPSIGHKATLDAVRMWRYEPSPKEAIEVVEIDFKNPAP